ncbi:nicotinate (nicotinamide) nucleotide adenylyltransferase [Flavonifractor sp. An92]|uniref:nicotinate (nicotinamide) nucleotide adenylyltransferase n=1 Tax=Flavonifractor sp. An92 TaxID=1965666 RepID=UPI000B39B6EB|nr:MULTISPECIES: nicotinate (nicotinamide) nucleotide adenylyltransferase [unclassified Flavonifractor]OUN07697.1 nicotinate (nicotinamide) nucleotide adenylyltransferase [Flavonifractor sp. An92]OUQ22982.1 nicotinate (nicotinamide) nucleotide adenylyltransferase [Flavonifractor sp. An135]
MKIGIYGGTFNPPHLGHMTAARYAMEALELDELLFIPAALPPHKLLPGGTPAPEARVAMTEILADNLLCGERARVSDLELRRAGKSYSSDTILELRREYPTAEFWFLMGSDMFLTLQQWHEPGKLLAQTGVAAFARTKSDPVTAMEDQAQRLRKTYGAQVKVLHLPEVVEISSTRLRAALERGEGSEFLCPSVWGYILMHQLYGTHADLTALSDRDLRACSYSMVKAKRLRHIQGTEEEAVRLALHWGADPEKARKAAILHDCTKYLSGKEQLQLCEKYGIVLDDLERRAVKLLHSKTGAAIAKHVFGMPDDIYDAIFWHTTGKADMTLLEKILYTADYMEPSREFDGVERLRELAYTDLDAAVLLGCDMSIADMEERHQPVHRNTLEARNWLRDRK